MKFAFDLISDLHADLWDPIDWTYRATSPFCVVAGDIADDHSTVAQILTELGQWYQGVFYIDGNDEHRAYYNNLGDSYRSLNEHVGNIENVIYLQDNLIIVNGVAILATNGWWTYDLDSSIDPEYTVKWFQEKHHLTQEEAHTMRTMAIEDFQYMTNSLTRAQTMPDIKKVVLVTHTVPDSRLVDHDFRLTKDYQFNCIGNALMREVLRVDLEQKVAVWCFGHYHSPVDRKISRVRYVNNCRGRPGSLWGRSVYHPLKIEIDLD